MAKKSTTAKAVEDAHRDGPKRVAPTLANPLSVGVSVFNLALTGNVAHGLHRGTYMFVVGDSSSGKSFLATTIAAQASIDPAFKDYAIYYDDVENGALFDVPKLFSQAVADRIKLPPNGTSSFVEDFYLNAKKALQAGPCVYILDSENGLTTRAEDKKAEELRAAIAKAQKAGKDTAWALGQLTGQMTDGKAKQHSQKLRTLVRHVEQTGSILVILGQTRDAIDTYEEVVFSGGRALKFYAHVMAHMTVAGRLRKTVNEQPRDVGINSKFALIKNRYNGRRTTAIAPIYYSVGYDEVGGMVDWLVLEKVWTADGKVRTGGFCPDALRDTLVKRIEANPELEEQLREFVQLQWNLIAEKCNVERRNRYQ